MKIDKKLKPKLVLLSCCLVMITMVIPINFAPNVKCDDPEDELGWGVDYIDAEKIGGI